MVLRESVIQVPSKDDTCTVYQNIKLWLVLFLALVLIEGSHTDRSFLLIVLLDEFVLYSFNEVLALVVISNIRDDNCGLSRELGCRALQSDLILANEDHIGALI
jgi:hypothetical protein